MKRLSTKPRINSHLKMYGLHFEGNERYLDNGNHIKTYMTHGYFNQHVNNLLLFIVVYTFIGNPTFPENVTNQFVEAQRVFKNTKRRQFYCPINTLPTIKKKLSAFT